MKAILARDVVLAAAPLVLIWVLMLRYRWSAARSGLAGYGLTLLLAWGGFGLGPRGMLVAHGKALLLSLDVLLIIWAAYAFYRVVDEAGAITDLAEGLTRVTADRTMQALLLGWAFASFLQSMGGFGVPVAVVAPLLVRLGFSPLEAVVIPAVGHGWAVSFGSLATAFRALESASGWPGASTAPWAAGLLGVAALGTGLAVAHAAGGGDALRRLASRALLMAGVMALVQWALARAGLWTVAALGGSLAGGLVGWLVAPRRARRATTATRSRPLAEAAVGYGLLVAVVLIVQFVPAVHAALSGLRLGAHFPAVQTRRGFVTPAQAGRTIVLLRHTGARLAYAALLAGAFYAWRGRYTPDTAKRVLRATVRGTRKATGGIVTMMALAVIMQHAGMTEALARGLAALAGSAYLWVAPWLGALGAFMTGSNTNANVLFGLLQRRTAELLGLEVPLVLAAQTAGAAVGSVLAPAKVIVGASTTRMTGREGEVMAALARYIGLLLLLITFAVVGWALGAP